MLENSTEKVFLNNKVFDIITDIVNRRGKPHIKEEIIMKKNNKGFTLVELIVVLVILAILAAILVPTLLGYIDRARSEKDFSTAQTVRVAAQSVIDQAYGEGYLADGQYSDAAKTTGKNKVTTVDNMNNTSGWTGTVKLTDGAVSYTDGKLDLTAGGKYERLVYTLSGVDPSKVTSFTFYYSNGIITNGTVTINGHTYTLSTTGSWSAV